jgi:hypothetical protein
LAAFGLALRDAIASFAGPLFLSGSKELAGKKAIQKGENKQRKDGGHMKMKEWSAEGLAWALFELTGCVAHYALYVKLCGKEKQAARGS